jgi:Arylsulfotransferase (ASST)
MIKELDPETGTSTLIYDEETDLGSLTGFHTNYVSYLPWMNAFSISLRHSNTIALLSYPDAQILGIFSGALDQFGRSWTAQHGHQFLQDGTLVVFNNTNNGPANVLSIPIDLDAKTAGTVQTHTGGPISMAFGDVQRLPNGNTFITYSNAGSLYEIDSSNQVVKTFETDPLGYSEHRATLYGPPPHLE